MRIRTRLTLLFALIVGTLVFAFGITVFLFSEVSRKAAFQRRLNDKAVTTCQFLLEDKDVKPEILRFMDSTNLTTIYDEEVTIYDHALNIIYDSGNDRLHPKPDEFARIKLGITVYGTFGQNEYVGRLYKCKADGRDYLVLASGYDIYGFEKMNDLVLTLALAWVLAVLATFFLGYFFSGKALNPISSIVQQVDAITTTNMHSRLITPKNKDELFYLTATFNQMLERLEQGFNLKRSFVSHASHELRTPLTSITGQLEVALMQNRSNQEYEAILKSLLVDIKNMNKLAHGLLELTQASDDSSNIVFSPLRMDEVLWEAREEVLHKHPEYRVNIAFGDAELEEDSYAFMGNMIFLKSAFGNLMENGCKFSADKTVQVHLNVQQGSIQVKVADNGIGISAKDLEYIFEPFYRADNARQVNGHGIGLSLTQKIIELHQGYLSVDSQVGQGTTFTVEVNSLKV